MTHVSLHPLAAALLAFAAGAHTPVQAQTHTLANDVVELKFKQQGTVAGRSNLWLTSIESLDGQSIELAEGLPLWIVEARPDPTQPQNAIEVEPSDLPLTVAMATNGTTHLLTATWGPGSVAAPVGPDPTFRVVATWKLKNGSDTATTKISVEILNGGEEPSDTPYNLWLSRYPRLAVKCLDADLDGSDRLAMGRNCGMLYGDPIHYEDGVAGPLRLTMDPDHVTTLVSPDSIEPSTLGIPASTYYDTESGLGFYHSNDDDEGTFKGIYWTQEPTLDEEDGGALLVQTVQYATGDIYHATSYTSPYDVRIAALDRGDWVAAAQRYRETWRGFSFYPGPAGAAGNTLFPQDLKDTPISLYLNSGDPYCIQGTGGFDLAQATSDLDGLASYMGTAFPYVYLNRFAVDVPNEVFVTGYAQDPGMADVHSFVAYAEGQGHRTVVHGMTEKGFVIDSTHFNCTLFSSCNYCTFADPDVQTLCSENAIVKSPFGAKVHVPCTRGLGDPSGVGVDWPEWWAELNADFSNTLGSSGGLGWPSPNPTAGWCFSTEHDHEPGFGNFLAQGWIDLLEDTASQVTTTAEFARTMETSAAFFSRSAGVQNTWNFDIGFDYGNFEGAGNDPETYEPFTDAPIWRIPMMQMAIDNAIWSTVYYQRTLHYPYVSEYSPYPIFDEYKAIPGALACWSMAERVLRYQSVVYLNNLYMVPLADVNSPSTPAESAASETYGFYRGLARFLTGTSPVDLIDYHTGSRERSPEVTIDGVTQEFVVSSETIDDHLATLETLFGLFGVPLTDLDWSKYQPLKHLIGGNDGLDSAIWTPAAPEEDPTYLPNGMYRHHDGESLAFLLANPWGVHEVTDPAPDPVFETPMNPFTFDFDDPALSPSTTYAYRFTFDPADYAGFPSSYEVARSVYDVDGQLVSTTPFATASGATEFTGALAPHEFAAWVFQEI